MRLVMLEKHSQNRQACDCCVVDHDVDTTKLLYGSRHETLDVGVASHVAPYGDGIGAVLHQTSGDSLSEFNASLREDKLRSFCRETFGDSRADTGASTGDNRDS